MECLRPVLATRYTPDRRLFGFSRQLRGKGDPQVKAQARLPALHLDEGQSPDRWVIRSEAPEKPRCDARSTILSSAVINPQF
jgi:hypothetical protein